MDLTGPVPVSRPAVSQHLRLMLSLAVVAERRASRERFYRIEGESLRDVEGWLERLDHFWAGRLRRLGTFEHGPMTNDQKAVAA
jgi:DNA-binding transcriptional ArsR family regulator